MTRRRHPGLLPAASHTDLARISHQVSQRGVADGHGCKARAEDSAGVLDGASRNPTERNAVATPGSAAAVETR
jgi:hypothetical protein